MESKEDDVRGVVLQVGVDVEGVVQPPVGQDGSLATADPLDVELGEYDLTDHRGDRRVLLDQVGEAELDPVADVGAGLSHRLPAEGDLAWREREPPCAHRWEHLSRIAMHDVEGERTYRSAGDLELRSVSGRHRRASRKPGEGGLPLIVSRVEIAFVPPVRDDEIPGPTIKPRCAHEAVAAGDEACTGDDSPETYAQRGDGRAGVDRSVGAGCEAGADRRWGRQAASEALDDHARAAARRPRRAAQVAPATPASVTATATMARPDPTTAQSTATPGSGSAARARPIGVSGDTATAITAPPTVATPPVAAARQAANPRDCAPVQPRARITLVSATWPAATRACSKAMRTNPTAAETPATSHRAMACRWLAWCRFWWGWPQALR